MEEEGQKIIKLNIGNVAAFGLEPPDEIVQDMIRNLPHAAGYTDSKGLFAPRKAVVHYTQEKHIAGVDGRRRLPRQRRVRADRDEHERAARRRRRGADPGARLPAVHRGRCRCRAARRCTTVCDERRGWLPDIDDIRTQDHAAHARPSSSSTRTTRPARCTPTTLLREHRRDRAPAPADRVRRRDLRQDAVRRPHAHQHRLAGRRRAVRHLQRPVEELPLLRLPRRLDGGVGRQAPRHATTSRA